MRHWYLSATQTDSNLKGKRLWPAANRLLTATAMLLAATAVLLTGSQAFAQTSGLFNSQPRFLEVDEAFNFYTSLDSPTQISIHWNIAPGYYLYDDKFNFEVVTPDGELTTPAVAIPEGLAHHDEFFGDVEVHYEQLRTTVTLPAAFTEPFELVLEFQGCAEAGLCYPPQRRDLEIFP